MRTSIASLVAWLAAPALAQAQQPPAQAPQSSVHARVLGLDGAALLNVDLQAMFVATYAFHGQPCRTGDNGEVQIAVPDTFSQAPKSRLVVMRRKLTGMQPTEYGGAVSIDLPSAPHGLIQVGDLRLQEEPVLVSGTVVDTNGKPVPGLELTTQVSHFTSVQNLRLRGAGVVVGGTPFLHVAASDANGRFVMRELTPADTALPLRVLHEDMWQLAEPPVGKPGVTDLRVVVAHTAAILVGMADAPRDGIAVRVERRGEASTTGRPFQRTPEGLLRFGRLQPGTYDVRLLVQGEVVWSAEGVEVRAGEDCADPRLQPVPWREHARVVHLRVKDMQDRPVAALITVRRAASPEQPFLFRSDQDGNATVGLAEKPGTMEIATPEHLTFRIDDPKGEIDVRMQARPRVRVTTPPDLQLPEGAVVQIGSDRTQAETTVHAGKDTVVRPDGAGAMPVRVCVRAAKNEFQQVWNGTVEVAPGDAVQDRVLGIDKASIEKLREMLGAKHH